MKTSTEQTKFLAAWVIVDKANKVLGTYPSRDAARWAKVDEQLKGKICKASEIFTETKPTPARDAAAKKLLAAMEAQVAKQKPAPKEKAAAKPKQPAPEVLHVSEIERPCQRVWDIAEEMPGAKRGEVLAACVKVGIAFYTARTQYQQWRVVQKEMAEREAKTGAQ